MPSKFWTKEKTSGDRSASSLPASPRGLTPQFTTSLMNVEQQIQSPQGDFQALHFAPTPAQGTTASIAPGIQFPGISQAYAGQSPTTSFEEDSVISDRSSAGRKTLKGRLLAAAAAAVRSEPEGKREKIPFRSSSVRHKPERQKEEKSIPQNYFEARDSHEQEASRPFSPDSFAELPPVLSQPGKGSNWNSQSANIIVQAPDTQDAQSNSTSYEDHTLPGYDHDTPIRLSFDSLRQSTSRPDTISRPSSRQSYEQRSSGQPRLAVHQEDLVSHSQLARPHQDLPRAAAAMSKQPNLAATPNDDHDYLHLSVLPTRESVASVPSSLSPGQTTMTRASMSQHSIDSEEKGKLPYSRSNVGSLQDVTEIAELRKKYDHVKRVYFAQKKQLELLQNTLANQRLSASRTHLDDGEYLKRHGRLEGLIAQLAFSIRRSWSQIPEWLLAVTNHDALKVGKQEMTAVGRAIISRWVVEEVFEKYFHPDLDLTTSMKLKEIQKTLRGTAPPSHNVEEAEGLSSKICSWRLTTIDGLQPLLALPETLDVRNELIQELSRQALGLFGQYMNNPPEAELRGGVHMIIELVVGILGSLPLESRDVAIDYFLPGLPINEELMKVESGIPALSPETKSLIEDSHSDDESLGNPGELHKRGLLGGSTGGKKLTGVSGSRPHETEASPRVRLCVSPALHIRGKAVLAKATVYRL